ncbi:hypothetical protein [Paenibacillus sp. 453mf]|nr:hypothetical protein [Paenibacillus sp. 453mf]SFT00833.1 hypothetical protein SAMN04488601_1211 [Paenibacillus sp. 453mf]
MSRKRLPDEERKETLTIRIKKQLIDEIKKEKNYNRRIENLIEHYLKNKG